MAKINVESGGAAPLNSGVLQLNNGVAMSSTLTEVTDQANTASPLKLSTTAVQVVSPLRVTTDDPSDMYLDLEDGSANNRFNITRNTASQQVNLNFASNPGGSTTIVGAIRTFTDGVNLGEVVKFREDGQVTFTERVNVEADSLVTTQSSSVIAATTTNANLVIAPNGTGALVASIPDGTVNGGNARGANAVDLQTIVRTNSNQVASGVLSIVLGGQRNKATSDYAITVGGLENTASTNQYSVVVGGYNNLSSGAGSFIGGGQTNVASGNYTNVNGLNNTASSNNSTVSGGQSNTASTNTHATVVGGQQNVASGPRATVGGEASTSSGQVATAFGYQAVANGYGAVYLGFQGTSSGSYAFSGGVGHTASARSTVCLGESNTANMQGAIALGTLSKAYLYGQQSLSSGLFSVQGDAQQSQTTSRREAALTTGGTTVLGLDGNGGPTNTLIPDGNNRSWNVQVRWVAVVTAITGTATGVTVGDTKVSTDLLAVAKRGGVTTVGAHTSAGTSVIETIAGSLTAANITYSAGGSGQMQITFTGPTFAGGGSVTMRVVAATSITEVAY